MRQRRRTDWPVRVYRYWVHFEPSAWSQFPEEAKQEAQAMRALWNHLVDAFDQHQAQYRDILSHLPQLADLQEKVTTLQSHVRQAAASYQAAKQQLRQRHHPVLEPFEVAKIQARTALQDAKNELRKAQREARLVIRPALHHLEHSFLTDTHRLTAMSLAAWANREFVLNQFLAAVRRFFKRQNGPPRRKGDVPQEVHFHHRFTSGGWPVERIFDKSQRFHLEAVPSEAFNLSLPQRQRRRLARTTGTFQVGRITLSFTTILHRPLPEGAYLKTVALIGRQTVREGYHQHQGDGHQIPAQWTWSLHLTLEVPPQIVAPREQEKPAAIFHLHPQVLSDGHLRLGVLSDSTGREEALFLPETILQGWQHKRELQRKVDQILEDTKERLGHISHQEMLPLTARHLFEHIKAARAPGCWRLLHLLEEMGNAGEALDLLRCWANRSTKLIREARGLERRYLGHRDWFYHNLALQLCQRYHQLAITAPDLQAGTAQSTENARYRQLTSPSRFIAFLRQAAVKTGGEIQERAPASSTRHPQRTEVVQLGSNITAGIV